MVVDGPEAAEGRRRPVADGLIERWGGRGSATEVDALARARTGLGGHPHALRRTGDVDPRSALDWHGVTTVVMGNCGVGFAPCARGREFLIELMEGVEDIPGTRSMRDPMAVGVLP